MEKHRILCIGDGVVPTGFSRVMHEVLGNLPEEEYDIHHLAVNYRGDPHEYNWKIYPAGIGGDVYGFNRLNNFANLQPDLIFIINDVWLIDIYLDNIKKVFRNLPKIVVYFPVDGGNLDSTWFKNFDIVTKAVVYTQYGYEQAKLAYPEGEFEIIGHGVNTKDFYRIELPKEEIKKMIFPQAEEFYDSFIVLNAN